MSGTRYEVLRYRGNVTGADQAQPGRVLGCDEFGRPYEVIDAEFEPCPECDPTVGWPGPLWWATVPTAPDVCPGCQGSGGRTTVQLQYATPDNLRDYLASFPASFYAGGEAA